jgi:hypothetical protein
LNTSFRDDPAEATRIGFVLEAPVIFPIEVYAYKSFSNLIFVSSSSIFSRSNLTSSIFVCKLLRLSLVTSKLPPLVDCAAA